MVDMENSKSLKFPVIEVTQPIGSFYIASIKARDLIDITYSDVRRMAEDRRDVEKFIGIQRPVNPKRMKEIHNYIKNSPDASFPTAVILAVDERCAEFDPEEGTLRLSPYVPEAEIEEDAIPYPKIGKVLDGQHRLAGFLNGKKEWAFDMLDDKEFDINVSIFIGADLWEQANIFATVNLAQTKVNKSLVYDLQALNWARSPYKTCHNVAVVLDDFEGPLFERIKRLGVATPGRSSETLTQAAFVESLIPFISSNPDQDRNDFMDKKTLENATQEELRKRPFRQLFIDDKEFDIAEILLNYFMAIQARWPNSWNTPQTQGNLLPRSNAFKAFMKYLRVNVYPDIVGEQFGQIPTQDQFAQHLLVEGLEDADFTLSLIHI